MWQNIIEEILYVEGYSEVRLAREVGVNEATIHRLRTGQTRQPRYSTGARLMSLYMNLQFRS